MRHLHRTRSALAVALLITMTLTGAGRSAAAQGRAEAAAWVVEPADAGPSLPPKGRSLFDHLTAKNGGYDLPFPFTALLQQLARRAHCEHAQRGAYQDCYRAVLIPLGRSLQRSAARDAAPLAAGDLPAAFFKFPRAVFAMTNDDTSEAGAPLAKDRLYLGYHESAEIIEVISYNETAARFEFQIVSDYRAGGVAQVVYANRAVCITCHQNHAPIFSRQVWDETNANPAIAQRLLAAGRDFYGVNVARGVDIPQAIDAAVNRANLFAAQQLLWQRGCGGNDSAARRCRAAVFAAALQYALSGELGYDAEDAAWRSDFVSVFDAQWQRLWPNGLKLPDAGLPNRDPLQTPQAAQFSHVAAKFEPLQARGDAEIWQRAIAERQLVTGIAATLTRADVRALNAALARKAANLVPLRHTAECALRDRSPRIEFDCAGEAGGMRLRGRLDRTPNGAMAGRLHHLRLPDGEAMPALALHAVKRPRGGGYSAELVREEAGVLPASPARTRRGHRLARFSLSAPAAGRATANIAVVDDFGVLGAAVEKAAADSSQNAFSDQPFRRVPVMRALWRALGLPARAWCCEDEKGLPALQTNSGHASPTAPAAQPELAQFFRYCASCHQGSERSPPNFLHLGSRSAAQGVEHCAPRIYYRLAMWQRAPQAREKTPMPPELSLRGLYTHATDWPRSKELQAMQSFAARAIKDFDERALLAQPYETLRSCLPPRTAQGAQQ